MIRIVVCDTGPLLHLSEAGAIHLLQNAGQILIPESVTKEFKQNAQGWNPPQWIEVHKLDKTAQKRSTKFIESNTVDLGEAEAIALAIQVEADWFVTMMQRHDNWLNRWDWNHTDQLVFCFGILPSIISMESRPNTCWMHSQIPRFGYQIEF